MKITIGEWKTRDGRKAIVAAEHPNSYEKHRFIGWIDGKVRTWQDSGHVSHGFVFAADIISPWTEPVPWDWSTTPPWLNVLHKGPYGNWRLFKEEPLIHNGNFAIPTSGIDVPEKYHPKWSGDWKLSKTMRPGHKEAAK